MNYIIWITPERDLGISPPIGTVDEEPITTIFLISSYNEVLPVESKKDALHALYDEYQTSDVLKEGDTFTFRGEAQPFAYAEGVHVLLYKSPAPIRYSHDAATRYFVTLDIETGVRFDNPAWRMAIQDSIIKGNWNIIAQQPVVSEAEVEEYRSGLARIHLPVVKL